MKNTQPELVIEGHPDSYKGLPFFTLVKFQDDHLLCVIDNITSKTLKAYVVDLCGPQRVNETAFLNEVNNWWNHPDSKQIPLSIYFSKNNLSEETSKIYRELEVNNIIRIVGPVQYFEMKEIENIRKRKRSKHRNKKTVTKKNLELVNINHDRRNSRS